MNQDVLIRNGHRNGIEAPKAPPKLSAEALAKVEDSPSNTQHYLSQDQRFERVSLGLDTAPSDMEALCRAWDLQWDEASKQDEVR